MLVLQNLVNLLKGYGFDTAMTIFVTDNIAAEVSLGLGFYKTKSSALLDAVTAYGSGTSSLEKRNQIFIVPVTLSAQYHAAPYGRPKTLCWS